MRSVYVQKFYININLENNVVFIAFLCLEFARIHVCVTGAREGRAHIAQVDEAFTCINLTGKKCQRRRINGKQLRY